MGSAPPHSEAEWSKVDVDAPDRASEVTLHVVEQLDGVGPDGLTFGAMTDHE